MTQSLILKNIRSKTGLSQEKFANRLEIKVSVINSIECDRGNITLTLLEKIAEVFPELNIEPKKEYLIASLAKELQRMPTQEEIENLFSEDKLSPKEKELLIREQQFIDGTRQMLKQELKVVADLMDTKPELLNEVLDAIVKDSDLVSIAIKALKGDKQALDRLNKLLETTET